MFPISCKYHTTSVCIFAAVTVFQTPEKNPYEIKHLLEL